MRRAVFYLDDLLNNLFVFVDMDITILVYHCRDLHLSLKPHVRLLMLQSHALYVAKAALA